MFVVIAILLFIACLATGFFLTGNIVTWVLLGLAIVSLIIHFVLRSRRRDL
jgi:hypothetical protein